MIQLTREQLIELFNRRSSTRYYDPNKKLATKIFKLF